MKTTDWFEGATAPVHEGPYEVDVGNGRTYMSWWRQRRGWGYLGVTLDSAVAYKEYITCTTIKRWRGVLRQ